MTEPTTFLVEDEGYYPSSTDRRFYFRAGQRIPYDMAVQAGLAERIAQPQIDATPTVDVREFGAVGSGDETTAIRDALTYAKANRRPLSFAGLTYTVDSLDLSFADDADVPGVYGYRAAPLRGMGPRSTILRQATGATGALITVRGNPDTSGTGHAGKATGALVSGMELRGQGRDSGVGVGLVLSIFQFASVSDLWITEFGGDAVQIGRPVRSESRDDYSHTLEMRSVKAFRNGGAGFRTPDDHATGPAILINCEAHSNLGIGYDLIPAGFTLLESHAFGNGAQGVRVRTEQNGSPSYAQGFNAAFCRFEGNTTAEVDVQGSDVPTFVGCTVLATTGAHCLVIGNGADAVRSGRFVGGLLSGAGGASGTAGQKAIVVGANGTDFIFDGRIDPSRFNDAYAANNVDQTITNGGNARIWANGSLRSTTTHTVAASTTVVNEIRVQGQASRRHYERGDGYHGWGAATGSEDTNLYRAGADILKSDDKIVAALGIGVGNAAAGTTLGAVTHKIPVFDANGALLCYVPGYGSIS